VLNLTDAERRILINQSRILAALYPFESAEFERAAKILLEGYQEGWEDIVLKGLKSPFPKEEMNFVFQVLEMYDGLQKSFYALSLEDKLQLREQTLVFPGFCQKTEKAHLAYAIFLLENLDRFTYLEVNKSLQAPKPMRDIYEEMVMGLPNFGGHIMKADQLKAVISYISAIRTSADRSAPFPCALVREAC
jgi:uncharacterized protein YfbU (UPF0304 family)